MDRAMQRVPRNYVGYFYVAPALVFLTVVVAVPILSTFKLSFEELEVRTRDVNFVGLRNYLELFGDPLFWSSFLNSMIFAVASTIGHAAVGIGCALLLIAR